jgi:hypothetical protein
VTFQGRKNTKHQHRRPDPFGKLRPTGQDLHIVHEEDPLPKDFTSFFAQGPINQARLNWFRALMAAEHVEWCPVDAGDQRANCWKHETRLGAVKTAHGGRIGQEIGSSRQFLEFTSAFSSLGSLSRWKEPFDGQEYKASPGPRSTDLEAWRLAINEGRLPDFRLESLVAAIQDLGPGAGIA